MVWDRLQEFPTGYRNDPQDPGELIPKLKKLLEEVLASGVLDGRMTDIDMRQLPPALR
jgi:hypothetical protein